MALLSGLSASAPSASAPSAGSSGNAGVFILALDTPGVLRPLPNDSLKLDALGVPGLDLCLLNDLGVISGISVASLIADAPRGVSSTAAGSILGVGVSRLDFLVFPLAESERGVSRLDFALAESERGVSRLDFALAESVRGVSRLDFALAESERGVSRLDLSLAESKRRVSRLDFALAESKRGVSRLDFDLAESNWGVSLLDFVFSAPRGVSLVDFFFSVLSSFLDDTLVDCRLDDLSLTSPAALDFDDFSLDVFEVADLFLAELLAVGCFSWGLKEKERTLIEWDQTIIGSLMVQIDGLVHNCSISSALA